jgi:hypothetical protein
LASPSLPCAPARCNAPPIWSEVVADNVIGDGAAAADSDDRRLQGL